MIDLPTALCLAYIFHEIGDYLTQNDWIANKKTTNSWVALLHATLYSLPFLLIVPTVVPFAIVYVTHFFIDRYRLAVYWIKLVNWNWESKNCGFDNEKPPYMSVWLMIRADNTWHKIINAIAVFIHYYFFV